MLGKVRVITADFEEYRNPAGYIEYIPQGPNQLVRMECTRCGEIFWRAYGLRHKRHQCIISKIPSKHWQYFTRWIIKTLTSLTDHVVRLEVKKDDPDAKLPTRSRTTDAGYDIYTITEKELMPGEVARFETGLRISAPVGWYYTIDGRSSLWSKGISPYHRSTIDGGYIGPIGIHLQNQSKTLYNIAKGDRIAQLVLHRVVHADFVEVTEFNAEYNHRGDNGFGSSGR